MRLAQLLNHHQVTLMQAPPLLLQLGPEITSDYLLGFSYFLRAVLLGGEPFPSLNTIFTHVNSQ